MIGQRQDNIKGAGRSNAPYFVALRCHVFSAKERYVLSNHTSAVDEMMINELVRDTVSRTDQCRPISMKAQSICNCEYDEFRNINGR